MFKSRKWVLVSCGIVVGYGIIVLGYLWRSGYLDHVPYATQAPIFYPNSHNIVMPAYKGDAKLAYNSLSFDTPDEPAKVTTFYKNALEADGWGGDSDTGGAEELHLARCYNPGCHELYDLALYATKDYFGTHVKLSIILSPYP